MLHEHVVERVSSLVRAAGAIKAERIIEIYFVVEIGFGPVASPTQIDIPRQDGPFAGVPGVAIEVIVFVPMIAAADKAHRGEVTDALRYVQVIERVGDAIFQRAMFGQRICQFGNVG